MKIQIPFEGFYNSSYESIFDDNIESTLEYYAQEYNASNEVLQAYSEAFHDAINWQAAFVECAKDYVESFTAKVKEETGLDLNLVFDELTSPREYNFQTDKIYGIIPVDAVKELYSRVTPENLQHLIAERHTSYDGFISFYSNRREEWPSDVLEWDEIQLATLLQAFLYQELGENWGDEFRAYALMEYASGNGYIEQWLWGSMTTEDNDYLNALDAAISEEDAEGFFKLVERHREKQSIKLKGEVVR